MFFFGKRNKTPTDPDDIDTVYLQQSRAFRDALARATVDGSNLPELPVIPLTPLTLGGTETTTSYTAQTMQFRKQLHDALCVNGRIPAPICPPNRAVRESDARLMNMQEHVMYRENSAMWQDALSYSQALRTRQERAATQPAPTGMPVPTTLKVPKMSFGDK